MFTEAPLSSRCLVHGREPLPTVMCRHVCPFLFWISVLAPLDRSSFIVPSSLLKTVVVRRCHSNNINNIDNSEGHRKTARNNILCL